jgi:hypothetical protein
MTKLIKYLIILLSFFVIFIQPVYGQMMGGYNNPTTTPTQQDLQDIQTGQDLYKKLQNKQITCSELKDDDFEKIGEFVMNKQFTTTAQHIQMNERAKQMIGENGEEQMHIRIGRNASNCYAKGQGGGWNMMGWGYSGMMGWNSGYGFFPFLIEIFILIDLILIGVWFLKKIRK